jgi:hypothetical protein
MNFLGKKSASQVLAGFSKQKNDLNENCEICQLPFIYNKDAWKNEHTPKEMLFDWYKNHFPVGVLPIFKAKANKQGQIGYQSEVVLTRIQSESGTGEKIIGTRLPVQSAKIADQTVALLAWHFLHTYKSHVQ